MKEFVGSFHFIRPAWLLLLPLAIGVWWLWQRRSDPLRGWREQIDPALLDALVVGREGTMRGFASALLGVWILGVIAVAGPTWRLEPSPFADDATPVMILLKADPSMESPDPAPSRIERARLKIADIAGARKGQPLGLIAYAGSAHLVLPPTRDTAIVAKMASEISPEIMPVPGDRLDLALKRAGEVFLKAGVSGTVIVLADSVDADLSTFSVPAGMAVHFLGINTPDSSQDQSLRAAAKKLHATVQSLSVADDDVAALVRLAARTPAIQAGDQSARWEEAGYWMLPLIALLHLFTFRRESKTEEVLA